MISEPMLSAVFRPTKFLLSSPLQTISGFNSLIDSFNASLSVYTKAKLTYFIAWIILNLSSDENIGSLPLIWSFIVQELGRPTIK